MSGAADASRTIRTQPLTAEAFRPFGEVIEATGTPTKMINGGRCARFSDLAELDFGPDGRAGLSVFASAAVTLPYRLEMMERHPDGSQAFLPLSSEPFLVIVAEDVAGNPGTPSAFMTSPGQGVNYRRGVWHGVLTPLGKPARFAVVDRIGPGNNIEEAHFAEPYTIVG